MVRFCDGNGRAASTLIFIGACCNLKVLLFLGVRCATHYLLLSNRNCTLMCYSNTLRTMATANGCALILILFECIERCRVGFEQEGRKLILVYA